MIFRLMGQKLNFLNPNKRKQHDACNIRTNDLTLVPHNKIKYETFSFKKSILSIAIKGENEVNSSINRKF